jgi:general transcription factor 3C polypeptide 3 (transcription factor C subunit 4)
LSVCTVRLVWYQLADVRTVACASAAGRHTDAIHHVRKMITTHQFNNEPIRLLFASLAGTMRSSDSFINTALQKHIFRELRIADVAVKNKDTLLWWPKKKRYGLNKKGKGKAVAVEDEEDDEEEDGEEGDDTRGFMPVRHNPVLMTLYGQMCNVAKSYQSAICMLLPSNSRAFTDDNV